MSDPAVIRRSLKEQIIRDMQEASRQVDDANGTSDYNMRLVALALIARHFLRECADDLLADPVGGASPAPGWPVEVEEARKALRCLYLEVSESVARDVGRQVEAAFAALKAAASSPSLEPPR
jgi:hypothetical protein